MSLVIDAPAIEHQLQEEAAKQGITAEQYAAEILSTHFAVTNGADLLSADERVARLDALIASNAGRPALPLEAFERSSFYDRDELS